MNFLDSLENAISKNNSLVCIGLDPVVEKMPDEFKATDKPLYEFNKWIIDRTAEFVCAFKPNSAFYEALGLDGIEQLKQTCDYIKNNYPDKILILDAKRGDIGSTNEGYIKFVYDYLNVDAITLHPYMGKTSLQPFLDIADKGCIILCRNSNEGAGEFQDLEIGSNKLYQQVALNVSSSWNDNNNCLLVTAATYPNELAEVRKIVGDEMYFLVPGVGAQGGDVSKAVKAGINSQGKGLIINSARAIIYSKDPAISAKMLKEEINNYR